MWCTGTWFSSVLEVLGGWLGLMILKVFFNRNDSMTIFEDSFFFFLFGGGTTKNTSFLSFLTDFKPSCGKKF